VTNNLCGEASPFREKTFSDIGQFKFGKMLFGILLGEPKSSEMRKASGSAFTTIYFILNLQNGSNKLECLFLADISRLVGCLRVGPRVYPRVKHLKGASLG
jgi:hypothetical protein